VAVWREVRRSGALQLQQSVIAFPDGEAFARAIARIRAAVDQVGGSTLALHGEPVDASDDERLQSAWNEARSDEYGELIAECEKLVAEIDKEFAKQKFTLAELDEEEQSLERLRRWYRELKLRDLFGAPSATTAESQLRESQARLEDFAERVYGALHEH